MKHKISNDTQAKLDEIQSLVKKAVHFEMIIEGLINTCRVAARYDDREEDMPISVECTLQIAAEWIEQNRPCEQAGTAVAEFLRTQVTDGCQ